jgi:hypothetical protein
MDPRLMSDYFGIQLVRCASENCELQARLKSPVLVYIFWRISIFSYAHDGTIYLRSCFRSGTIDSFCRPPTPPFQDTANQLEEERRHPLERTMEELVHRI